MIFVVEESWVKGLWAEKRADDDDDDDDEGLKDFFDWFAEAAKCAVNWKKWVEVIKGRVIS